MASPRPTFDPDRGGVAPGSERRPNPVVGDYAVDRSAYWPSHRGVPEIAWYDFAEQHPANRTGLHGAFQPYRERDLTRILSNIVNRQGAVYDLQLSLVQAGFLDDDVHFGYVDSDTAAAMEEVLSVANQHGLRWEDVLSQAAAAEGTFGGGYEGGGGGGGGGAALAPIVITLPNRDDVVRASRDTALALTGEALDDDLAETVADHALDALRTQQERQVQLEMGATGGETFFSESAPDVGRLLEDQIRELQPDAVVAKGARDTSDLWQSLAGGPL